ncbi:MAG: barstar family protein [Bulleidia sp.]
MKTVYLDASRIKDRNSMSIYMHEIFSFPPEFGKNLDAVHDLLCEVQDDTDILLTHACIREITSSGYAFKVLLVLGRCADENPHIRIHFSE